MLLLSPWSAARRGGPHSKALRADQRSCRFW